MASAGTAARSASSATMSLMHSMILSCSSARPPPSAAWVMRATTSSPKATCGFVRDARATSWPVLRSSSEPTTVVVPTSKATPKQRAVVSPGSKAMIS